MIKAVVPKGKVDEGKGKDGRRVPGYDPCMVGTNLSYPGSRLVLVAGGVSVVMGIALILVSDWVPGLLALGIAIEVLGMVLVWMAWRNPDRPTVDPSPETRLTE